MYLNPDMGGKFKCMVTTDIIRRYLTHFMEHLAPHYFEANKEDVGYLITSYITIGK